MELIGSDNDLDGARRSHSDVGPAVFNVWLVGE